MNNLNPYIASTCVYLLRQNTLLLSIAPALPLHQSLVFSEHR